MGRKHIETSDILSILGNDKDCRNMLVSVLASSFLQISVERLYSTRKIAPIVLVSERFNSIFSRVLLSIHEARTRVL